MTCRSCGSSRRTLRADGVDTVRAPEALVLFTPRYTEAGTVVGYEEKIKNGVVLWDTRGKRIGSRYVDLRSRGTNARNSGLTIVFRSTPDAERLAVAQVTIEDIKQHLGIQN